MVSRSQIMRIFPAQRLIAQMQCALRHLVSPLVKQKRALKHRFVPELILMTLLQLYPLSIAAQQGSLDYYAHRSEGNETILFHNVQSHHLEPGRADAAKGRYDSALQHFEFILRYYPNHPLALAALIDLCQKWKTRACDAEGWIKKGIERNPRVPQTYLLHGIYLHKDKRYKEAVKDYQRALELAPDSVNAHYNLGLAYADLKEYELSNKHAQISYQLGANLPGLRLRLEKLGKWSPAAVAAATDTAKPSQERAADGKSTDLVAPEEAIKTK